MTALGRSRTVLALGLRNLARVGLYRIGLKSGMHPVQRISANVPLEPFFRAAARQGSLPEPDRRWQRNIIRFDWHVEQLPEAAMPDWLANPFAPNVRYEANQPWWLIPDFGGGDIKGLWEISRFGWVVAHAGCAAYGDEGSAARLNGWIADWTANNPPYLGPNWKCGQEASIRVMHLAMAAIMLDEDARPLPGLLDLIALHCARIAPTISYALGQANNHGTSEAAALFIGGSWLHQAGDARGAKWAACGRRWLEERSRALILPDGSFSQYSVVYHRLMLDSYVIAECWRQRRNLPAFSSTLRTRLARATDWLAAMVDRTTGDAPNAGPSDGARLLPVADTGYRDFRPTLEAASRLFKNESWSGDGFDPALVRWLAIERPSSSTAAQAAAAFNDGGWQVLRNDRAMVLLRVPRYRFRPAQADALHCDLTVDGINLLRDAGTFSYNDPAMPDGDLAATRFHNSISFDGQDQMPRLSRFLYADWSAAYDLEPARNEAHGAMTAAAYHDACGNHHRRRITLEPSRLVCEDRIEGPFSSATLRWRLPPGPWTLDGRRVSGPGLTIDVDVDGAEPTLALVDGHEAREYLRLSPVRVLEVTVDQPCTIATTGEF